MRTAAWGQGYATEGTIALIDKAFRELGAERVFATTMTVNTGSRRVMEKAGMRLIRTFRADWPVRIDGDQHGDVEYAITRQEWAASRT
jgi:RimJ/RimL family protein N-acetyltransferase